MLKGTRCETAKCAMERQWRARPPGLHGWRRVKPSEYGLRLREKQKVKRYYGVLERQFKRYFALAVRQKGNTGENLLAILERRLDNVVRRAGFFPSPRTARQAVVHGHIYVNGRRADRPGMLVRPGDRITVKPSERSEKFVRAFLDEDGAITPPNWLQVDRDKLEITVTGMPTREDILIPVEEQLIVEISSR